MFIYSGLTLRKKYSSELGWGREDIISKGAKDNFMYYEKLKENQKHISTHGIDKSTAGKDAEEHLSQGYVLLPIILKF